MDGQSARRRPVDRSRRRRLRILALRVLVVTRAKAKMNLRMAERVVQETVELQIQSPLHSRL